MSDVVFGQVKFVNAKKGFGFVTLDGGGDAHFWLDRGHVPVAGWRSHPMGHWTSVNGRVAMTPPPTPQRGQRLALEVAEERRGPTANWWAHETQWREAMDEIRHRADQYPVGLYYYPLQLGVAPEDMVEVYLYPPGETTRVRVGWDYSRIPAMWAIVNKPGELPHEPHPRNPDRVRDRGELAPTLGRWAIVEGRDEYLQEVKDRADFARRELQRLGGNKVCKQPNLLLDSAGNGEVRYGGGSFVIEGGRVTRDEPRIISSPFAGLDYDHPDYNEGTAYDVVGGNQVKDLEHPASVLANILLDAGDTRKAWPEVQAKLKEAINTRRSHLQKQVTILEEEVRRREHESLG